MKIYVILQTPHGSFWKIWDKAYTKEEDAKKEIGSYLEENPEDTSAWLPYIEEIELKGDK